jgi:pSer/pThr/pTyr-binding forkhead associated (FHA) protein
MTSTVVLKARDGALPRRSHKFSSRALCVVGRSADCSLQLPGLEVSRRHCLLDIDPPVVHIRDLGSRNGTFVNGVNIGQRDVPALPESVPLHLLPSHELHSGDQVEIGTMVFDVTIVSEVDSADNDVPAGELVMS